MLGLVLSACWLAPAILQAQPPVADSGLAVVAAIEEATIAAIELAERSVVAIARVRRDAAAVQPGGPFPLDPFGFGNPFPSQDLPDHPDFVPSLFGSGIVLSQDGFIVTCAHVLGDPRQHDYYVWLDKQSYPARVIGMPGQVLASDPFTDLAVLKIDAADLQPVAFSAEKARKGQFVIALGNPYAIARDGRASASWGIVSNVNRVAPTEPPGGDSAKDTLHHFGTLIQTDAKLNSGTSGGALVNLKGEVIGMTTALAASAGYEQAAGFAIATDDMFQRVVDTLKNGRLPEFGFLGIQPENLRAYEKSLGLAGARVSVVIPGLPGELAGLRADDVIYRVDETAVEDRNDLFRELSRAAAGTEIQLYVHRFRPGRKSPEALQLSAQLSKRPSNPRRPGFAVNAPAKWRGMLVDYATAVPSDLVRGSLGGNRRQPVKLAILTVDPDSPAWQAGLRPGYGVVSVVDGRELENPDDFYEVVRDGSLATQAVDLVVVRNERAETVRVAP